MTLKQRHDVWKRKQRVKKGKCFTCGKRRKTESPFCEGCLEKRAIRARKYRLSPKYPIREGIKNEISR